MWRKGRKVDVDERKGYLDSQRGDCEVYVAVGGSFVTMNVAELLVEVRA